ncbi:hypothetical protein QYE76_014168 [Lolium multiflorum]|uniref:Retrotransposon gag domain-containing protein n=1 Tax=Lolium multiflorum TaxID=4521 RepID=A0AAD8X5K4_LOLMU|nr:hypothetical protein QYE76_014168 [Lolium multiflorum]
MLPLSSWWFCRVASLVFPLPDSVDQQRIWLELNNSLKVMVWFGLMMATPSGVVPVGPAIGDFPCIRGLLSIQGLKESRSGGAPPTVPWVKLWSGCTVEEARASPAKRSIDGFADEDDLLDWDEGSFLDATIARSRQIENTETPNENAATPVNSPESVEYSSDDLDEDYVELDDDFIEKCNATTDARKIKKLLAEHAVRYKLSPDPKFATSPINIRDKDYDFSLDLSHIAIVEKTPFCGTEKESAVEHMTELSTLSGLFSDDIKMRTYFVAKIFPFSLKDDAKTWYNNLPPGSIKSPKELLDVFFRNTFASAQHAALQRIYNFDQEDGEKLPEAWARFCSLIRAQPDHDLEKHDLLDIFYSGLTIESRAYLDSCAGCVFRKRTPDA